MAEATQHPHAIIQNAKSKLTGFLDQHPLLGAVFWAVDDLACVAVGNGMFDLNKAREEWVKWPADAPQMMSAPYIDVGYTHTTYCLQLECSKSQLADWHTWVFAVLRINMWSKIFHTKHGQKMRVLQDALTNFLLDPACTDQAALLWESHVLPLAAALGVSLAKEFMPLVNRVVFDCMAFRALTYPLPQHCW